MIRLVISFQFKIFIEIENIGNIQLMLYFTLLVHKC